MTDEDKEKQKAKDQDTPARKHATQHKSEKEDPFQPDSHLVVHDAEARRSSDDETGSE
jgi:hypothetical protein